MFDSAVNWIEEELRFSKSRSRNSECSWGRQVIIAISNNDAAALMKIFRRHEQKSSINEQCTLTGYAEYMWTPLIHKYIGDTALHLALKQRKEPCISALLILGADCSILNKNGESGHSLALKYFNKSIENFQFAAIRNYLSSTHPKNFELCPVDSVSRFSFEHSNYFDIQSYFARIRKVEEEAWELMKMGRCLYTELPKTFKLQVENEKRKGCAPYLSFNITKQEGPKKVEYWFRRVDEYDREYFYNEVLIIIISFIYCYCYYGHYYYHYYHYIILIIIVTIIILKL